jgi:hypothetical protein
MVPGLSLVCFSGCLIIETRIFSILPFALKADLGNNGTGDHAQR